MAARTNRDWSAKVRTSSSGVDPGHLGFDGTHHVEGGSHPAFHDGQEGAATAVLADHVLLREVAVPDMGDLAEGEGGALGAPDGELVEVVEQFGAPVQFHGVLGAADLGGAPREDEVLVADGIDHVLRPEMVGFEGVEVEVDGNHPGFPAIGPRDLGTLDGGQSDPDLVLA
jgi:hypothetical protein